MDCKTLCEIIERSGCTPDAYSGRGMYGSQCLGFVSNKTEMVACLDLIQACLDSTDSSHVKTVCSDLLHALGSSRTDSMGRGIVIYFPSIKWEEDLDEEDEEDAESSAQALEREVS